jgi:peptidoglycan/LPS O-acetylase OafA/YrhL
LIAVGKVRAGNAWDDGKKPVTAIVETAPAARIAGAPLTYRPDIDGMRAVAVMLVLIFHFSLVTAAKAGFLGVDIFFVISGFLITTILRRQLDTGTFYLGAFYLNRIRRLAPALLVVLLLTMMAGAWWLFPDDLVELSKQALVSQYRSACRGIAAGPARWRSEWLLGQGVKRSTFVREIVRHRWAFSGLQLRA